MRRGRLWTDDEIARLRDAAAANVEFGYKRGYSRLQELADELGRSYDSVKKKLSSLGIAARVVGGSVRSCTRKRSNGLWTRETAEERENSQAGNSDDVRDFLRRGGTITVEPMGKIALTEPEW